eukprot:917073-Pelagomonas_calceolata.AAC.5
MCVFPQVLDKVRQEQLGFGPYVQSLEAALQAKDSEHSRLTQALLEAQHAKEKAKQVQCWCMRQSRSLVVPQMMLVHVAMLELGNVTSDGGKCGKAGTRKCRGCNAGACGKAGTR